MVMPINFYKEGGVSKIQFASGQIAALLGRVSIFVDNSVNQLIIAEDGRDKYWISTSTDLQVEGEAITGTNQQKANLIAPVFAAAPSTGGVSDFSTLDSYASNADAVDDLGVGKLYKSTTLINSSPIILITA